MEKAKYIVTNLDGTPVDCPAFVLLAKDIFAIAGLRAYKKALIDFHPDGSFTYDVEVEIYRIRQWQEDNPDKIKIPD